MRRGIIVGGMILGLLMGCNNGIAELEKKNSFYESVVKIGHEFQEIFGIFGHAMGEALGFRAVKSTDNRSAVGDHFDKVKQGLENTKTKLGELSGKISATKNADTKGVEAVISSASGVITELIGSVGKLAKVTKASGKIGEVNAGAAAVVANKEDVQAVIDNVKEIIKVAKEESGVKIEDGDAGSAVAQGNTDAPAVINAASSAAGAAALAKLAAKVSEADPWAMIDKIKSATTSGLGGDANDNNAGQLATANASANTGAKADTTADLAAAVALKAMTKEGKFSAPNDTDGVVKGAAANAVNKVLAVLDEIIRRTVAKNLEKVREAVKGIQYSETTGEATEAKK